MPSSKDLKGVEKKKDVWIIYNQGSTFRGPKARQHLGVDEDKRGDASWLGVE